MSQLYRYTRNAWENQEKAMFDGVGEYLIKTYTNEGMTVLDNTMGSGSTGVAAKKLNRNFIGMELDKEYFEIAKQRINEA